jgi:hypothetical protein
MNDWKPEGLAIALTRFTTKSDEEASHVRECPEMNTPKIEQLIDKT